MRVKIMLEIVHNFRVIVHSLSAGMGLFSENPSCFLDTQDGIVFHIVKIAVIQDTFHYRLFGKLIEIADIPK